MTSEEDKNLETVLRLAQDYISACPLIVLGSGASAAEGLPTMGQLKELFQTSEFTFENVSENTEWDSFLVSLQTLDLESALLNTNLSKNLIDQIITKTWNYISHSDLTYFNKLIITPKPTAVSRLISHLSQASNPDLAIATTNYDRLGEYSLDLAGLTYSDGFSGGYIKQGISNRTFNSKRSTDVDLIKVHGSLDWFQDPQNVAYSFPLQNEIPNDYKPLIVTPGIQKFRGVLQEPFRSLLQRLDQAIIKKNHYMCIGYGFNDEHIHPKLIERCRLGRAKLLILTRTITENTLRLLEQGCCQEFLALEMGTNNSTKCYSHLFDDIVTIPNRSIWQLDELLKFCM